MAYDTEEDIGTNKDFEIPLNLAPIGDHTVEIYTTSELGGESSHVTETYSFEYPNPEISSKAEFTIGGKKVTELSPGEEFAYRYDLKLENEYSKFSDINFKLPIDKELIDQNSIKNIQVMDMKTLKTFEGTLNTEGNEISVNFPNGIEFGEKIAVMFQGKIIDSEALINRELTVGVKEIEGLSGQKEEGIRVKIPSDQLTSTTVKIVPGIATLTVRFVDEDGIDLEGYTPIVIEGKTNSTVNLKNNQELLDTLANIKLTFQLQKEPENPEKVIIIKGAEVSYQFSGVLQMSTPPSLIDFSNVTIKPGKIRLDDPIYDSIIVHDTRKNSKGWTLSVNMEQEFMSNDGKRVLANALLYRKKIDEVNGEDIYEESVIGENKTEVASANRDGAFLIDQNWGPGEEGLIFEYEGSQIGKLGEFKSVLVWTLGDTPQLKP